MRKLLVILSVLSLFVAYGCKKNETASAPADAATIKLGVQGPETGDIAVYGLQTLYGAQLAADEINAAGGINGKKIELIHYDSRGEKSEAVAVANRLINDKVCGTIGEPTTGAVFAIRNIYNDAKTIQLSAGSTADNVVDGMPYSFRNTLLDKDGAPATIKYLVDNKGWKNYAIITSANNDYSVGLSNTFKKAVEDNGGAIVIEQFINDKDTNISAQVTALRGKQFDAVIFTGYYQEASLILMELRKQGINVPLVGGDGFQSPELANVAKDAALGTIFFAGFSTTSSDPKVVEFTQKLQAAGHQADMFAAQGYDALYLLANAAKEAGVTNCADADQRSKMRDVLAATQNYMGISGEMSFDAEGNGVKKPFIQEVAKTPEGTYFFQLLNQ